MKLSLPFIAEKLAFSYNVEVVNENPSIKYGTVRLFDSALSTSTKYDPLVVVPAQFEPDDISSEFKGVIWIGSREPNVPQPVIWVKDDVNAIVILDRVQNFFDMHNSWCEMVRDELLQKKSFEDIIPLLSHVTINPFYYADAGMRTLAIKEDDTLYASSSSWRMQLEVGRHPVEILSKFITSGELDAVNERHDAWLFDSTTFHTPFISRTIFCQGDVFGHLFIVQTYPGQEVFDTEILETFGELLEAHLNLSSLSYSSTGRPYEPMLVNQLSGTASGEAETDYLLKLLSWRNDDHFRVAVFKRRDVSPTGPTEIGEAAIQAIEDNLTSCKAFQFEGNLVCVINENLPESISTEELISHLCERFGLKASLSNLGGSFRALRTLYKRALVTMDVGLQEKPGSLLYRFEDYRLSIVFTTLTEYADEDFLIHDDLRTLIAYDEKTGSEFVATLKAYLDTERNSSRTADLMFLHRNSIAYRLDKMRLLMMSDLDDPDNRLFLMLSIYIWLHSQRDVG